MRFMVVSVFIQALCAVFLTGCEAQWLDGGTCDAEQRQDWSYRGRNGPSHWGEKFPLCYEQQQSPIDISTTDAEPDSNLQKLKLINYNIPMTNAKMENNGHTVHIEPDDGVVRSIEIGQPPKSYTLRQFHFHWGDIYYRGSEHTLNEEQFAMELHFVHISDDEEIAVVGVIFQEQLNNNQEMESIVKPLRSIKYKGNEINLTSNISLECLLPENPISYYRYQGSLTTPTCGENVIWTVAKGFVGIGTKQMMEFRKLKSIAEEDDSPENKGTCRLVNNYRPVQMLNGRKELLWTWIATRAENERKREKLTYFQWMERKSQSPLDGGDSEATELRQQEIVKHVFQIVSKRDDGICNFLEGRNIFEDDSLKVIYRHYATLYIVFCVDSSESELGILDLIQVFVETLDKCFKQVCELDLVFNVDKVHYVLNEIITGGLVAETTIGSILQSFEDQQKLEKNEIPVFYTESR